MKSKSLMLALLILTSAKCPAMHKLDMKGCNIPISDYGILTAQEKIPNKNYHWQCFPTKEIMLNLFNWVRSDDKYLNKPNPGIRTGELHIVGFTNGENMRLECQGRNEYTLSQTLSTYDAEKFYHQVQDTIKDKKYACIYGKFSSKEIIFDGQEQQPLDNWHFVKIRTKNHCYSYNELDCEINYK